jgi:two-component system phosphate regulon response regulator OmpR
MNSLLIVDDDSALRDMVSEFLSVQGHTVQGLASTFEVLPYLTQRAVDLLILDITMPLEDGFTFLTRLRALHSRLPVLVLSGRAHEVDRVRGLNLGADDYLTKPFCPAELLARVQALLRRCPPSSATNPVTRIGHLHFDHKAICLRDANQAMAEVPLSTGERALLKVLAEHPGRTLSRQELLTLLSDDFGENFDRSIDVRVTRLRKRLGDNAAQPRYLHTIRGQGYRFEPDT